MSTKTVKNNEVDENIKETEIQQLEVEEVESNSQDPAEEVPQQPEVEEPEKETKNEKPKKEENSRKSKTKTGSIVNTKFVRLRKFPSQSAQVLSVLTESNTIEILEKTSGYYQVKVNIIGKDVIGYVSEDYLKED